MFGALEAGEETAVKFWDDHVEEVKNVVPRDKLLIWEVKEGWGPLCEFLRISVPSIPFPNVNDTSEIEESRRKLLQTSWLVVVFLPLIAVLGMFFLESSGYMALTFLIGFGFFICYTSRDASQLDKKCSG